MLGKSKGDGTNYDRDLSSVQQTPRSAVASSGAPEVSSISSGIRERGGPSFGAASPFDEQRVQADMRSHLIHRPARDTAHPGSAEELCTFELRVRVT